MTAPTRGPRRLAAAALAAVFLVAAAVPARAGDGSDPLAQAEQGLQRLITALQILIATIPQYEMPEVLENGDILIRRVPPQVPADPADSNGDGVDETSI